MPQELSGACSHLRVIIASILYYFFPIYLSLILEMEHAPLTTPQLKAVFHEFTPSVALGFSQFKEACS